MRATFGGPASLSMATLNLAAFTNDWYTPGRSRLVQVVWFFIGLPMLRCPVLPGSELRVRLLRVFGAKVGKGVVIKPGVRVKYPWRLRVGDHAWIGEDSWIDNLGDVSLGANSCVSQGAYFCTGNHNWNDPAFGLVVKPIEVRDGAWVAAKAFVGPGVTVGMGAVAAAGSVVVRSIPDWEIHAGNPAQCVGTRRL